MSRKSEWIVIDLLFPQALFVSLLEIWSLYTREGRKPGRERWLHDNEVYRPMLFNDIRDAWRRRVGAKKEIIEDPSCFPYSKSFVIRSFTSIRKMTNTQKIKFLTAYEIPIPDRIQIESDDDEPPLVCTVESEIEQADQTNPVSPDHAGGTDAIC